MITDVQIMMFLVCIASLIFFIYSGWKQNNKFAIVILLIAMAFLLEVLIENWGADIVQAKMEFSDIALMAALLIVDFCAYKDY